MDTLTITGLDSFVEYSLLSTVNSVAQNLLKQQPMLLPQVYKNYCTAFHDAASSRTMSHSLVVAPECDEHKVPTKLPGHSSRQGPTVHSQAEVSRHTLIQER